MKHLSPNKMNDSSGERTSVFCLTTQRVHTFDDSSWAMLRKVSCVDIHDEHLQTADEGSPENGLCADMFRGLAKV